MLIVLSGLPGTGKTTIGREVIARQPSVYLRIDVIEHALRTTRANADDVGSAGYLIACELARSNLASGMPVLADCVNPLAVSREAWRRVAASAASPVLEVEIVCSDLVEHRRRVESRETDIPGFTLPTWEAVISRNYEAWTTDRLIVDSAVLSVSKAADVILNSARLLAVGG